MKKILKWLAINSLFSIPKRILVRIIKFILIAKRATKDIKKGTPLTGGVIHFGELR